MHDAVRGLGVVLQNDAKGFFALVFGFLLGLALVYDGFRTWQLARLIQDTPTERVRSISAGRTEIEGVVRAHDGTVAVPRVDADCVHVDWRAERREYRPDDDGSNYEWVTVGRGRATYPFELDDGTGRAVVRADTDGVEFDIEDEAHTARLSFDEGESPPDAVAAFVSEFDERVDPTADAATSVGDVDDGGDAAADEDDDGLVGQVVDAAIDGPTERPLSRTDDRRRYEQTVLPVGADAYVFGSAEPRAGEESDQLEVRHDDATDEFLVADAGESTLQQRYSRRGPLEVVGGLALSALCLYLLLSTYLSGFV